MSKGKEIKSRRLIYQYHDADHIMANMVKAFCYPRSRFIGKKKCWKKNLPYKEVTKSSPFVLKKTWSRDHSKSTSALAKIYDISKMSILEAIRHDLYMKFYKKNRRYILITSSKARFYFFKLMCYNDML